MNNIDNKLNLLLNMFSICSVFDSSYQKFIEQDLTYCFDQEVIDCQLKLYLLLLVDDEELETRFENFIEAYDKLSIEKKEYIKNDFKNIIEQQDIIQKEKEKRL